MSRELELLAETLRRWANDDANPPEHRAIYGSLQAGIEGAIGGAKAEAATELCVKCGTADPSVKHPVSEPCPPSPPKPAVRFCDKCGRMACPEHEQPAAGEERPCDFKGPRCQGAGVVLRDDGARWSCIRCTVRENDLREQIDRLQRRVMELNEEVLAERALVQQLCDEPPAAGEERLARIVKEYFDCECMNGGWLCTGQRGDMARNRLGHEIAVKAAVALADEPPAPSPTSERLTIHNSTAAERSRIINAPPKPTSMASDGHAEWLRQYAADMLSASSEDRNRLRTIAADYERVVEEYHASRLALQKAIDREEMHEEALAAAEAERDAAILKWREGEQRRDALLDSVTRERDNAIAALRKAAVWIERNPPAFRDPEQAEWEQLREAVAKLAERETK